MNERLFDYTLSIFDPDNSGGAVAGSCWLGMMPIGATLVYACVAPHEDDSGATIDIQDDTVDIVTAIDASDHDVPGEWISTHCGGANAPVSIAAGSVLEIDANNTAATTRLDVTLTFLAGESWG